MAAVLRRVLPALTPLLWIVLCVLGQLQTEKVCSAASMLAQCRILTRTTTLYGELDAELGDVLGNRLDRGILLGHPA